MNKKELTKNSDILKKLREQSKPSKEGRTLWWREETSHPIYFPERKCKK